MIITYRHKSHDLIDYKFYCFNGEPKYCQVIYDRSGKETIDFFDLNWRHQEFTGLSLPYKPHSIFNKKPDSFELMIDFCKQLAKGCIFLRIDFFEVNRKLYFGEITFYPASGFGTFSPDIWNYKLGELIEI